MSGWARATERSSTFGRLGAYLLSIIADAGVSEALAALTTSQQVILLSSDNPQLQLLSRRAHTLLPAAASLLLADYPVQVPLGDMAIRQLAAAAFGPLPEPLHPPDAFTIASLARNDPTAPTTVWFPKKRIPAAESKANISLPQLLKALMREGYAGAFLPALRVLAGRATDDQATGCILYALGLGPRYGPEATTIALKAVLEPDGAKALSTALKGLGANSSLLGACLTEANVLQGRATGSIDLVEAAAERCDPAWVDAHVFKADEAVMRDTIRRHLARELEGRTISYAPLDEFWDRRWQWCVNGAHSRAVDRPLGFNSELSFPGIDRVYRRMAAEATVSEPISSWDGATHVSASPKLEHGKTRAIFACDTRSYFAFEHLLGPVSAAWQHKRIILDPGRFGHLGMARKVQNARRRGGLNLMLDYDDFNSHHSTRTMQILFEELCCMTEYPPELAATLVASFDKCELFAAGRHVGHVEGTLMSGHRGTSFINSVLNAVYIDIAVGRGTFEAMESMHVGDDVYIAPATYSDAGNILTACHDAGCRMNPTKQSVGTVGAEFLRLGIRTEHSVGYLARSVASFVSGNWTNDAKLGTLEAITSAVGTCRAMMNRSGFNGYPEILSNALADAARIRRTVARSLLSGHTAVQGSPVWHSDGLIRTIVVTPDPGERLLKKVDPQWPTHASDAYLARAADMVERLALAMTKVNVQPAMLLSSYRKAVVQGLNVAPDPPRVRKASPFRPIGSAAAADLLLSPRTDGVLTRFPLLPLLKGRLTQEDLLQLVATVGGDVSNPDIATEAWGGETHSTLVRGVMSYSDASSLAGRTTAGVVHSSYPVYM